MDLRAASDFLLMPQMSIQPVPVEPIPSLPPGTMGLILGRGSLTLQGLVVHPGVMDCQHSPEIQVLCSSPKGVFSISKGDRIAQLLMCQKTGHRALGPRALKDMGTGLSGPRKQSERRPRKTHKGGPACRLRLPINASNEYSAGAGGAYTILAPGNHGPYSRPGFTHLAGLSSPPWSYGLSTFP
ncbi:dUTP diphosphatase [Chlamydia trachomatis]|nr:dUTP diphosphatase [Chlamydia trachomatis]